MQIVLLGYMGSGKTTVGKLLSEQLVVPFLDLDAYIETAEKLSIPEIFEEKGELYFRKKEHFYLQEVIAKKTDFVLSTGGGTPCYGNNIDALLKSDATVVYLKVPIAELVDRLAKQKDKRPLIRNIPYDDLPEFIGKHLFERNHFYNRAELIVDCKNQEPEAVVKEISSLVSQSR